MKLYLFQIAGMARYEFKMQWRRRTIWGLSLAVLIASVAIALFVQGMSDRYPDSETQLMAVMSSSWMVIYFILIVFAPLGVADVIPIDEQMRVRDFLNSAPLPYIVYLLGKLIGTWLTVFSGMCFALFISCLAWLWLLDAFDFGLMLTAFPAWTFRIAPLVAMNCGLSVLLAARMKRRRSGIFVGIAVGLISAWFLSAGFAAIENGIADFGLYISPSRPIFILFSGISPLARDGLLPAVMVNAVWQTIIFGFIQLIVVGLFMWGWIRWRGERT